MIVRQIPVGTMANFVYLLVDEGSREALIVDSGWETQPIVKAVEDDGANVKYAVATHGHFDHVSTLRELAAKVGAKVAAHEDSPIDCDLRVADGQGLTLGKKTVKVLHTPGHTEDSICLYVDGAVFTGDTLFVGTIGRFDHERARSIYGSLHGVILKLPETTLMYPGHDYGEVPWRTLGEERADNPFLAPKDFRSFQALFS